MRRALIAIVLLARSMHLKVLIEQRLVDGFDRARNSAALDPIDALRFQ